jgi:Cu2+-exporting ATPase
MDTPVNNWDTYERPAIMREFVRDQNNGTRIADLLIQGVHCAACTWLIETSLQKIPGVLSIEVNPITTRGELHWDPKQVKLAELLAVIEQTGYQPTPFTEHAHYRANEQERRLALRRLLVAGLGMMQVSSYAVALYAGAFQGMDPVIQEFLRFISLLVATPIVLYSGAPFFAGAWRNIRARSMGMDVPVALAIGAAWAASVWNTFSGSGEVYFDSATMFVFFLSGTRYLEAAGRRRALELTNALAQHIPCTAIRLTPDGNEEVGVMELQPGDRVQVLPGIAFPADGLLEDVTTHVDESMLTGESRPVTRHPGDAVVAGTVNLTTSATLRIEKTGANTVLAQIGRLVTMAGKHKPALWH